MTELEYRRTLLLTRIDAHRSVLQLEWRFARASFHPLRSMLSMLGVDGAVAGAVGAAVGALGGGRQEGGVPLRAIVPMAVAALLPLVAGLRSERAADDESTSE